MEHLKPYDFNKEINGDIYVTVKIPIKTIIPARMEVYENDNGEEYYEEDYSYSVDQVIENSDKAKKINSDINIFKQMGWEVVEISE